MVYGIKNWVNTPVQSALKMGLIFLRGKRKEERFPSTLLRLLLYTNEICKTAKKNKKIKNKINRVMLFSRWIGCQIVVCYSIFFTCVFLYWQTIHTSDETYLNLIIRLFHANCHRLRFWYWQTQEASSSQQSSQSETHASSYQSPSKAYQM